MKHTDQSRSEFEEHVLAPNGIYENGVGWVERNADGTYRRANIQERWITWQASRELRNPEITAPSAPVEQELRNSDNRCAEESSGVELPEPGIDTANHAGVRVRGYTEQQVRELLASANEARREAQRQLETIQTELAKLERYRFMLNRGALVPPGYVAVPVEPTEEMFVDGMEASCVARPSIDDDSYVRSIWNAMLAAARRGREEAENQPETRMDAGSDGGGRVLPDGYKSGIQTDERVTLIFEGKTTASAWFEGFMDRCDGAANGAPAGWVAGQPITEDMHVAACKVLTRANGLEGLPQRMLDAMLAAAPRLPQTEWLPIESAPRDGTVFYTLIDGLPYQSFLDDAGRFVRMTHSDIATGPTYKLHRVDGMELREMLNEAAPAFYEKVHMIWQAGFDHQPTHWMPLPQPPKERDT